MFRRCEKNRKNFQAESAMKKHDPELLSNISKPAANVAATPDTTSTSDSAGGDANTLPQPVDY